MKMRSKRLGVWLASLLLLQTVTGPLAVVAQEVPDQEVVATVAPAPAGLYESSLRLRRDSEVE